MQVQDLPGYSHNDGAGGASLGKREVTEKCKHLRVWIGYVSVFAKQTFKTAGATGQNLLVLFLSSLAPLHRLLLC